MTVSYRHSYEGALGEPQLRLIASVLNCVKAELREGNGTHWAENVRLAARLVDEAIRSTPRSGIYVASRVVRAPIWRAYRDDGIPINASWIDEAGEGETADFGELWLRIREEIRRSRALVFYAAGPEDFPFKGALVEVGIALAMDKPVYVVLNNVSVDGRTMRPIGSWILDRRVKLMEDLDDAIYAACEKPERGSDDIDLLALLRDIQGNAAVGEPDWETIEPRIQAAIRSIVVSETKERVCESCDTKQRPSWQCFNCGCQNAL